MKGKWRRFWYVAFLVIAWPVLAHHSFANYDMGTTVELEGVIDTVKFRNPHMTLTFRTKSAAGVEKTVNFESGPANMLVRLGLTPAMIQPGTKIKAIVSPKRDGPDDFFLKAVVLQDGTRYQIL